MRFNHYCDRETKADRLRRERIRVKREKERKAREQLNYAAPELLEACKNLVKHPHCVDCQIEAEKAIKKAETIE